MRISRPSWAAAALFLMSCSDDKAQLADAGTETVLPSPVVVSSVSDQVDKGTCPLGGTKFQYGIDDNANGVLDAGEVDSTQIVCNKDSFANVRTGDLNLYTAADIEQAKAYTGVIGTVYIDVRPAPSASTVEVSLPKLTFISGALSVPCTSVVKAIHLPALEQVGGQMAVGCASTPVETVEAPALKAVGNTLTVSGPIAHLAFPALSDAYGISLSDTTATSFPFPALSRIREGGFQITGNASMDECEIIARAHAFRSAQALRSFLSISGNQACSTLTSVCPAVPVGGDTQNFRLCYRKVASWTAAKTLCESLGTGWSLMYLSSEAERASLAGTAFSAVTADTNSAWLGYTDVGHEGTWTWVQNVVGNTYAPQTTTDGLWTTGEPNGFFSENCGMLYPDRLQANDSDCANTSNLAGCRYLAP